MNCAIWFSGRYGFFFTCVRINHEFFYKFKICKGGHPPSLEGYALVFHEGSVFWGHK